MLARQPDLATPTTEAAPEVAPQTEAAATEAQFSAEGPVPETTGAAVEEPGKTASEQAFGDKPTAQSGEVNGGMYEAEEYYAACQAAGTPDKWDDRYWHGHTEAKGWSQPYDGKYDMTFELKHGHSASQAVKDFLKGPTIADFRVIGVAIEMDELRDNLGDQRFDQLFGSSTGAEDARIAPGQRLKITRGMYTIPFAAQMMELANQNDLAQKRAEPESPAVEAGLEEQPTQTVTTAPAAELIAGELGVQREQELA